MAYIVSHASRPYSYGYYFPRLLILFIFVALMDFGAVYGQVPVYVAQEVRTILPSEWGVPYPDGLTYSPNAKGFILFDESGSGRSVGENTSAVTISPFDKELDRSAIQFGSDDVVNTAIDTLTGHLYILNSESKFLEQITLKADGAVDPTRSQRFNLSHLSIGKAKGMEVDSTGRKLFILADSGSSLLSIDINNPNGLGEAKFVKFRLSVGQIKKPRGIAIHPISKNLFILSKSAKTLFELAQNGAHVTSYSLNQVDLADPSGLAFAPSSDMTDAPNIMHLFIADRGPKTAQQYGKIVEISLTQADPVLAQSESTVRAAATNPLILLNTVNASAWSPPSPDPAGISYIPTQSRLLISDSEVNEIQSLFTGDNLFESTFSGSLLRTGRTIGYSDEPTGVAFNPSNNHLYISDDDDEEIYEIAAGGDGQYGTSDDIRTSFDTLNFNSGDPEGVAFDSLTGFLYIADGINREVYRVNPGSNGLFDGTPAVGGDDVVTSFDTQALGIFDPEGIEYDAISNHLFLVGNSKTSLYEVTTAGALVQVLDISAAGALTPAGIAVGPSSINPANLSYYIVDRGVDNNSNPNENDGKIYEFDAQSSSTLPTSTPTNTGPPPTSTPTSTPTQTPTPPATCGGPIQSLSVRVSTENDDAEESGNSGAIDLDSSDLELVVESSAPQVVGIRFQNITIPAGNLITSALIEFETDETGTDAASLLFKTEANDNAPIFTLSSNNISTRPTSAASVSWNPVPTWPTVNEKHRTPDLSSIVQEVIDRVGWTSGNPLVFLVTGSGQRTAESYKGEQAAAPLLLVEHCPPSGGGNTPTPTFTPTETPTVVDPTATPTPTPTEVGGSLVLYVSSTSGGTAGGVSFADEDILTYDTATSTWALFYDGSDVSGGADLNAFTVMDDGSLLLSFNTATSIAGLGSVDDSDIVRFIPSSTGASTTGTFEWYLDGSDVGLTSNGEDIDSISLLSDGRIIVSTLGSYSVVGVSGADEDLISFTPTQLGSTTSGTWNLYFDGSDVALNNSSYEDIYGTWIDNGTGDIYLTTRGNFAVSGASGTGTDIFVCAPGSTGTNTTCTFSPYWDGSANGYGSEIMDGLAILGSEGSASAATAFTALSVGAEEVVNGAYRDGEDEFDDLLESRPILRPEVFLPFVRQ